MAYKFKHYNKDDLVNTSTYKFRSYTATKYYKITYNLTNISRASTAVDKVVSGSSVALGLHPINTSDYMMPLTNADYKISGTYSYSSANATATYTTLNIGGVISDITITAAALRFAKYNTQAIFYKPTTTSTQYNGVFK